MNLPNVFIKRYNRILTAERYGFPLDNIPQTHSTEICFIKQLKKNRAKAKLQKQSRRRNRNK